MVSTATNTTNVTDACKAHGQCIRNRREAAKLTQVQAANEADVVQSYYQAVESGSKPLYVHRVGDFGDFAILGTVDHLLAKLKDARYELREVEEAEVTCPEAGYKPFVRVLGQMLHEYSVAMDDDSMDTEETKANLAVLRELLKRGARLERGMERKVAMDEVAGKQFPKLQKVRTGEIAESRAGGVK